MLRVTLSSLLARKRRLALSGTAIVLGVTFVTCAFVFTGTIRSSQAAGYARMYRDVDVVVQARSVPPSPEDPEPVTTVPAGLPGELSRLPGVRSATGVVNAPGVRILGPDGKILDTVTSMVFGTNWRGTGADGGDGYVRLRAGRGPTAEGEVAVNAALAEDADLSPGRTVTLLTAELERRTFTVVGVYGYADGRSSAAGADEMAFQTPVASRLLLGDPDRYTALHLRAAPGVRPGRLRDDVARAAGPAYQVSTGRGYVAGLIRQDRARGQDFFQRVLLGFAGIAVGVAALLIVNTFLILVAQRTRELALLRALGASRRQLVGSVLVEAAVVGAAGTLLGIALGIGLGGLLILAVSQGAGLDVGGLRVPPFAIGVALAIGLPVTLLASLPPAVRAARIPPVAAMREAVPASGRIPRRRASAARGTGDGATGRPATGRRAAPRRLWSIPTTLGWRNARRNPRRTALTAAALMIGMTVTSGASVVVASANASLRQQVSDELNIALLVQSSGDGGGIAPAVVDRIAAVDGVDAVTGHRFETVRIAVPGRRAPVEERVDSVTDLAATVRMFSLATRSGRLATAPDDAVLVDAETARRYHLAAGTTVTMTFAGDRSRAVTVAGVYADSGFLPGWVAGPELVRYFTSQLADEVAVSSRQDAAVPGVRRSVEAIFAADPTVTVNSLAEVLDAAGAKYDQVLLAVQGLLALAVLIAVLGVVNTLALSVIERTRELGILRAVGLRRGQTMRMIAAESVVIAVLGGSGGLVLGLLLGAAGVRFLHDQGVTRITVPWAGLAGYLVLSVVIGVFASLPPARRAARTNVLSAIADAG